MAAPDRVLRLVDRFANNRDEYRAGSYNEAQVRQEFIDPLFAALGWDIDNSKGAPEAYKEVVHEDAIKIGGAHKAPDYSFRAEGSRKFFVEAKKPSVNLHDDVMPAFQLRRYAWSAKLPLSVLTDFEEFVVYDTRVRPAKDDNAATARLRHITYDTYPERWDEIAEHFSREAVYDGAFDRYAEQTATKRGTEPVDTAFLKEIEEWRTLLARNIALRNPGLSQRELNFAVQMTIDRIIFLRMAEDRGIEAYGRLLALRNGGDVYTRLRDLYRQADERYNSGLFHFHAERGRDEEPDRLTPALIIDDKPLKEIFRDLYYPDSPYEFSVLPVDVLGQVYEQFLGKVIRLTPGRRVVVEEKPEVRKAGGVYYTPTYIVDYIVEHTVGKLLEGKTPRQVSRLKIVDPACGSGSFLIGAYQCLLDWHRDWYVADGPDKHRKELYESIGGEWRLTTAERKRILLNNIYGVDIDPQAVEVTKLSLLLKQLEGATDQAIGRQLQFAYKERVLPDLSNNIKCGNSLIGPDFYDNQQMTLLADEDHDRLNVFDWQSEFTNVFNGTNPGFDAVIGNPPYRRELDYKYLLDEIAATPFGAQYRAPRMDLWYYFVHRGLELLKTAGALSFIVNAYWLAGTGSGKLISALRSSTQVAEIFYFRKLRVFDQVSGQHMIIRVKKERNDLPTRVKIVSSDSGTAERFVNGTEAPHEFLKLPHELFRGDKIDILPSDGDLLPKLERWPALASLGDVRQGIAENPASVNRKTNERFGNKWRTGEGVFALREDELSKLDVSDAEFCLLRPYYDLSDVGRYRKASIPSLTLIYSTRTTCPDISRFPGIEEHLSRFRMIMEQRRETANRSNQWWHLHWPREERIWEAPKILSIQMAERPSFVPVVERAYVPFSMNVFVPLGIDEDLRYITGLLNSRTMWKWFQHHAKRRGVGLEINGNVLRRAPIRTIDFDDPADAARHDRMVVLVERMLGLHERLAEARTSHDRTPLQRQIEATDRQIDRLVYELYELTDDEICIVEDATR